MRFEVEQKHRVEDAAAFVRRLEQRGVALGPPIVQADRYFNHPGRDFAQSDEALRIRTVGESSCVTYKGPKLAGETKTRRELELPLSAADPAGSGLAELLSALGFTEVAMVEKIRRPFRVASEGREVAGALDEVGRLGRFVELELIADDAGLNEARRIIAALAGELELGTPVRESYLELLLSARS